jgi:hypothetical protein
VVGSQCAFIFSSGGGSSDEEKKDDKEEAVIVKSGSFGGPVTAGLGYESGTLAGVTGGDGEFRYQDGTSIRFFIGDIQLGSAVKGNSIITPQDLVPDEKHTTTAATNITRLLLSLDSNPADKTVNLPGSVGAAAVRSNASVAAAIEYLDFADDGAFTNSASQLVAVLTQDYPYTATLVDGDSVPMRMFNLQR